ncbi:MAG: hypothetical protein ABSD59_22820 [Terracidiphilus sp.]
MQKSEEAQHKVYAMRKYSANPFSFANAVGIGQVFFATVRVYRGVDWQVPPLLKLIIDAGQLEIGRT